MRRFLIDPVPPGQLTIDLGKEECHHIQRVLRLKQGDTIELFDGQGMVHQATITALTKRVTVTIQSSRQIVPPRPRLHLHLGLLKGKKMELLVQKATELGVHALHPFTSDFTEARPPREQKKERWQKISLEACKQCGRNWPLAMAETSPLEKQLDNLPAGATSLLFWEDEKKTGPGDIMLPPGLPELHLFIGPEGGFSAAEVSRCQEKMSAVSLGPLTLRAETAVITALSLALFLSGRMDHQ
ncbi:MAG: RsmE family RNA methyltransferase [Desulfurivibrionaceae bacterium]|nr:RsmE family RNA methyltransferase [Desulfurivibrionaceae bacterium]